MFKLSFLKPWESAIAVLHDNILGEEFRGWEQSFEVLKESFQPAEIPIDPTYTERRRESRFLLSLPVQHRVQSNRMWEETKSLDVSQNGIRLALDTSIPNGTYLDLNMKLPNQRKSIRLKGIVVWGKPSLNGRGFECGVAFENFRNNFSVKGRMIEFMADRLCKMAIQEHNDLVCRMASTREDLEKAYQLVYKEYEKRKICKENLAKMHYSYYCFVPQSRTFILESKNRLVGTMSLLVDSPCGIPMESLFSEELSHFRRSGRLIAEVSLLALDHDYFGKKSFSLTDFRKLVGAFKLFKMMFDYARFEAGVTDLFIAMHPKHSDLYRYLQFETIGPVKTYDRAEGKPALPMHMDIGRCVLTTPRHLSIQKYFIEERLPQEIIQERYRWSSEDVQDFLMKLRSVWPEIQPGKQAYFKTLYPGLRDVA